MPRIFVAVLLGLLPALAGAGADESDWFADVDAEALAGFAETDPWFGELAVDTFAYEPSQGGTEVSRQQWSLVGGWQGDIGASVSGKFGVWWRHDSAAWYDEQPGVDYKRRENQVELDEAYLDWQAGGQTRLKFGRQKIGLGYAQGFRVLDAFSPLDSRIPGYGELSRLKLPQTAVGLSHQSGDWFHRGFYLAEQRRNLVYRDGMFGRQQPEGLERFGGGGNWLYAVSHKIGKLDWQAALGKTFNPQILNDPQSGQTFYQTEDTAGVAASYVADTVRWFTENRWYAGREVVSDSPLSQPRNGRQHLLGLTYTGISHLTVQAEYQRQYFADQPGEDAYFLNLRYQALREALTLAWQHSNFATANATADQFSAEYNLSDGWYVSGGLMIYRADDGSRFRHLADNDMAYLMMRYFW